MVIAAETIFATEQVFKIDENETWFGNSVGGNIGGFFVVTLISIIFLLLAYTLVVIFVNTGKKMQIIGTTIKIIPLLMIVLLAMIGLGGVSFGGKFDGQTNEIFNPNSDINQDHSGIISILLIMPSILFAFDGFLFASSLSTESEKPSTYKNAAIISITLITLIYILFSLSTYLLAEVEPIIDSQGNVIGIKQESFGINAIIHYIFTPNVAEYYRKYNYDYNLLFYSNCHFGVWSN